MSDKIAIIRIRGGVKVKAGIKAAMAMLRLYKKNYCVVVEDSPSVNGMISKIKDYVTWGKIDDETFKLLIDKRGQLYKGLEKKGKFMAVEGKRYKPFFRLNPPRGGFERKGIKIPFGVGGALGNRGDKIKELIKRMV